jgi:hypothetical protein
MMHQRSTRALLSGLFLVALAAPARAGLMTRSIAVRPGDVQITPEQGGKKASYRNFFDFELFDGDRLVVDVTLPTPMTIADLGSGSDDLERAFFGTLNSAGRAATIDIVFEFKGVSGSLLVNPINDTQLFTGNLTDTSFSFTGMRYDVAVSKPLFPGSPILEGFGFGFDFTADDVQLAGARGCGDGAVNTPGEECDEGGANGMDGSCCTVQCTLQPAGRLCRAAASVCDVAETCDGANGSCPTDALAPDGTACDDGVFCNGADACVAGVCARHATRPAGTACETIGGGGACDGAGLCVLPICGNGAVEPTEQCDGGECCTAACRLRGPTEPCGVETRVCHEQPLCNGREATCPQVDRLSPEGSTCSDANECTVEDTCRQGGCTPGPLVCNSSASVRGNGKRKVKVEVVCETDEPSECEAQVVAGASGIAAAQAAQGAGGVIASPKSGRTRRIRRPAGALGFRKVFRLRLNRLGKELLARADVEARVAVTTRRQGREFHPPDTLVRLLRILRRR